DKQFYYLTSAGIYRFEGNNWKLLHQGKNLTALTFSPNEIYIGTSNGYYTIDKYIGKKISEINAKLPVPAINDIQLAGTSLWFASSDGAFLEEPDRYRYFAGRRWLDQNSVVEMAHDSKGDVY